MVKLQETCETSEESQDILFISSSPPSGKTSLAPLPLPPAPRRSPLPAGSMYVQRRANGRMSFVRTKSETIEVPSLARAISVMSRPERQRTAQSKDAKPQGTWSGLFTRPKTTVVNSRDCQDGSKLPQSAGVNWQQPPLFVYNPLDPPRYMEWKNVPDECKPFNPGLHGAWVPYEPESRKPKYPSCGEHRSKSQDRSAAPKDDNSSKSYHRHCFHDSTFPDEAEKQERRKHRRRRRHQWDKTLKAPQYVRILSPHFKKPHSRSLSHSRSPVVQVDGSSGYVQSPGHERSRRFIDYFPRSRSRSRPGSPTVAYSLRRAVTRTQARGRGGMTLLSSDGEESSSDSHNGAPHTIYTVTRRLPDERGDRRRPLAEHRSHRAYRYVSRSPSRSRDQQNEHHREAERRNRLLEDRERGRRRSQGPVVRIVRVRDNSITDNRRPIDPFDDRYQVDTGLSDEEDNTARSPHVRFQGSLERPRRPRSYRYISSEREWNFRDESPFSPSRRSVTNSVLNTISHRARNQSTGAAVARFAIDREDPFVDPPRTQERRLSRSRSHSRGPGVHVVTQQLQAQADRSRDRSQPRSVSDDIELGRSWIGERRDRSSGHQGLRRASTRTRAGRVEGEDRRRRQRRPLAREQEEDDNDGSVSPRSRSRSERRDGGWYVDQDGRRHWYRDD